MVRIVKSDNFENTEGLTEEDIAVMFPASKNYDQRPENRPIDDPLQELLDEYLDEDQEQEQEQLTMPRPQGALKKTNKPQNTNEEIALIEDVIDQISYFLKEIEFYTNNK